MKSSTTVKRVAEYLSWLIAVILFLLPFHAFLTVWGSSLFGHYELLRLWKELLLVIVLAGAIFILIANPMLRQNLFSSWLVRLIGIYGLLLLLLGAISYARHDVGAKALAYGLLLDLRFLFFFLMVLIIAGCSVFLRSKWRLLAIVPATAVMIFGVLQYLFLPYDFLRHFGYGPNTISPYETINHNVHRIRIASTLRGANPLGAYLVMIISVAAALLAKAKPRRLSEYLWLVIGLAVLAFTYSRSAWIGAVVSLAIIVWLSIRNQRAKKLLGIAILSALIICTVAAVTLRHNTTFEDVVLHTDHKSTIALTSNEGHASAFKSGAKDIFNQPLGAGPGTAGPASVYNTHPTRIAENYFLQIGQETGIIGLGLFLAIYIMIGRQLWLSRADPLALALFASLIGLSVVNMLSHAWTDDTLAYIWWGLAGIALSPAILKLKSDQNEKAKKQLKTS